MTVSINVQKGPQTIALNNVANGGTLPVKSDASLTLAPYSKDGNDDTINVATMNPGFFGSDTTLIAAHQPSYTYDSSDELVATVAPDGGLTLLAAGDTTITISSAETESYLAADDYTFTLVVVDTAPTVSSVTPDGTGVAIGGDITVTFSEAVADGVGTVSLNHGVGVLPGGSWNGDTYTVTYSGLDYSTEYTVTIEDFKDAAGNVMDAVTSGHTFTTVAAPSHAPIDPPTSPINPVSDAVFAFNGDYADIDDIHLNGNLLTQTDQGSHQDLSGYPGYTPVLGKAESGSVKVTLYKEFLQTLPDGAYTLTVSFTDGGEGELDFEIGRPVTPPYNPGPSTDSGSDTQDATPISIPEKKPNQPTRAITDIPAAPDKNNALLYTITEQMVKDALTEAKKGGSSANGYDLVFNFTTTKTIDSLNITFTAGALALLEKEGVKNTAVTANAFRFSFDAEAVKELNKQSGGKDAAVSAARTELLSYEAKRLIGSRPAWDVNISYQKNGKAEPIVSLGKGFVTLGMRYTAKSTENSGNLAVIYVPGSGKPQILTQSSYDTGWMIVKRGTLSVYGVGYIADAPAFTDTKDHWAKDNIDFSASRGLLTGTGAETFSPNGAVTRGMFITALGRLSGQDVSGYTQSSFTDVTAGSYYLPYIEWAVANKIAQGVGNGRFNPDASITREEMAVMMQNYATATQYTLPITREAVTFTDSAGFSSWAADAIKALQQAGVVSGVGGNRFNAKGTATRAEAATILRNLVELVIDPGTARGWVKNDAGQWMYYTWSGMLRTGWIDTTAGSRYYMDANGVMVSGKWEQIGGKWYYFYADGKLAVSTKIDGYEVGSDGARK